MISLAFKDFGNDKRVKGENGFSTWSTDKIGPKIGCKVFEFSVKIHERSALMIGVAPPNSPFGVKGKGLEEICGYGLQFSQNCYVIWNIGTESIYRNISDTFGNAQSGDVVRFVVNKQEKTMHAQIVGKNQLQSIISPETRKDLKDFGEELNIVVCRYSNQHQDVEIVDFKRLPTKEETEEMKNIEELEKRKEMEMEKKRKLEEEKRRNEMMEEMKKSFQKLEKEFNEKYERMEKRIHSQASLINHQASQIRTLEKDLKKELKRTEERVDHVEGRLDSVEQKTEEVKVGHLDFLEHIDEHHTTKIKVSSFEVTPDMKMKQDPETKEFLCFEGEKHEFEINLEVESGSVKGAFDYSDMKLTINNEKVEDVLTMPRSIEFEEKFTEIGRNEIVLEFKNIKQIWTIHVLPSDIEGTELFLRKKTSKEKKKEFGVNEKVEVCAHFKNKMGTGLPFKFLEELELLWKICPFGSKSKVKGFGGYIKMKKEMFLGDGLVVLSEFEMKEDGKYQVGVFEEDWKGKCDFGVQ